MLNNVNIPNVPRVFQHAENLGVLSVNENDSVINWDTPTTVSLEFIACGKRSRHCAGRKFPRNSPVPPNISVPALHPRTLFQ